jgi:putative endopeptidase
MQMLAAVDVHAPGKLRTNVTLTNFPEFHEEFGITASDAMWRAPQDRVIIW